MEMILYFDHYYFHRFFFVYGTILKPRRQRQRQWWWWRRRLLLHNNAAEQVSFPSTLWQHDVESFSFLLCFSGIICQNIPLRYFHSISKYILRYYGVSQNILRCVGLVNCAIWNKVSSTANRDASQSSSYCQNDGDNSGDDVSAS